MNLSDFMENALTDLIFRGQSQTINGKTISWSAAPSLYFGLLTAAPSDSGGGTEVSTSGTGYSRVGVAASLANFAGTQGAGTTVASTGTGGQTSNNVAITFGTPSGNWGQVTHAAIYDAASGGNLIAWFPLTNAKNINTGDPAPSFAAGAFTFTLA